MKHTGLDMINKPAYDAAKKEIDEVKKDLDSAVETIPTDAKITALANSAIQADKDIVSQIVMEYSNEEDITRFIFPKGIVPLKMYSENGNDDYVYFDYKIGILVDRDNVEVLGFYLEVNDETSQVIICYEGYYQDTIENLIYELVYFLATSIDKIESTLYFNAYYLFNPITSAGTKLYKHDLRLGNQYLTVISKSNIDATNDLDKLKSVFDNIINNAIPYGTIQDTKNRIWLYTYNVYSSGYLDLFGFTFTQNSVTTMSFDNQDFDDNLTDTVTEL